MNDTKTSNDALALISMQMEFETRMAQSQREFLLKLEESRDRRAMEWFDRMSPLIGQAMQLLVVNVQNDIEGSKERRALDRERFEAEQQREQEEHAIKMREQTARVIEVELRVEERKQQVEEAKAKANGHGGYTEEDDARR